MVMVRYDKDTEGEEVMRSSGGGGYQWVVEGY